ncbi:MAG TPA: hypothetical protein DCL86_03345 [Bacteroidales bacterium]|nr:hypothetical protein [Bacteroidales bacterium]
MVYAAKDKEHNEALVLKDLFSRLACLCRERLF